MATTEADDPIMISVLQHYSYCPRQCALIHQEQVFDENVYTLRGRALHARVDEPGSRFEDGVRVERALPVYCERLGLIGKADVVEFHSGDVPYPVEYKHGPRRPKEHDELQLAAQAMCLEEMTGKKSSMVRSITTARAAAVKSRSATHCVTKLKKQWPPCVRYCRRASCRRR